MLQVKLMATKKHFTNTPASGRIASVDTALLAFAALPAAEKAQEYAYCIPIQYLIAM
jgi:hypothetical protein